MGNRLSPITIDANLPAIRRIFTALQVDLFQYPQLDAKTQLRVWFLEKELGLLNLMHAMRIIGTWLDGTPFRADKVHFEKSDPKAKWDDLLEIIEAHLMERANDTRLIEIVLHPSGRAERGINGNLYTHDFEGDGQKADLLRLLANHDGYMDLKTVCKSIGCSSVKSLNLTKKNINDALRANLKLPKSEDVIVSKRGSGYAINPIYNIITGA